MALSAPATVESRDARGIREFGVKASTRIYRNAIASIETATGFIRGATASAGDIRAGIAREDVNNTGAGGAATCEIYTQGEFLLTGSGFAQTDVGALVYASADDTITKTSTNNVLLGRITRFVSATKVWVDLLPFAVAS